jgi:hypothetical protein
MSIDAREPRTPPLGPTPVLLLFKRTPGAGLTLFLNRNEPMGGIVCLALLRAKLRSSRSPIRRDGNPVAGQVPLNGRRNDARSDQIALTLRLVPLARER